MRKAQYIQHLQCLPERALDTLYESLSVQTMPEGRYDGIAWIHGHPVLGWLASLVWRGKVFDDVVPFHFPRVRNRVLGVLFFRGCRLWAGRDILIYYPRLGLADTVRQVSPTLYLGRMQWRRWTVHFTLSQERT